MAGNDLRVRQMLSSLLTIWGEEVSSEPADQPAIAKDAISLDDQYGRAAGLVVRGDGLSVEVLLEALACGDLERGLSLLPPELAERVRVAGRDST